MGVTIRTVARHAGVSVPTVSRVINAPQLVNVETRSRVLQSMRELDYEPNELARGLRLRQVRTLGVIIPGIRYFFFNELYRGIDRAATAHGLNVLLFDSETSPERVREGFAYFKRHRADGILFASRPFDESFRNAARQAGIPTVLVLTESDDGSVPAFKVNDVQAAFDAVAYVVRFGHRRIGIISGPLQDSVAGISRYKGYRLALAHFGLPFSEQQAAFGGFRYDHGYTAMERLLSKRTDTGITAVFVASDEMALGALRCLRDHRLEVPADVSVIGFDNLAIADMVSPKLTTVAQPFAEIGQRAVDYLVERSIGGISPTVEAPHYLPHAVIERESVAECPE